MYVTVLIILLIAVIIPYSCRIFSDRQTVSNLTITTLSIRSPHYFTGKKMEAECLKIHRNQS